MNTSIEVYLGAPIDIESERRFLSKLCGDLEASGHDAVILANFLLPPQNPIQQIDFLVILRDLVCHVELKNLTAPVVGQVNGTWDLLLPDGSRRAFSNPYRQALRCKYAVSDEMREFAKRSPSRYDRADTKFFKNFESVVCVYPFLIEGSKVPSDKLVSVLGYQSLLDFMARVNRNPGWSFERWKCFAMELGLVRNEELIETRNDSIKASEELVEAYCKRFLDCHGPNVAKVVSTTVQASGKRAKSIESIDLFAKRKHGQLIGPSGSGKSLHVEYCAVKSVDAGRVPIIVRAIEYAGKLSTLLDRGIAHLCPRAGAAFIEAARRIGKPLTLIIDGFNECPSRFRDKLIQDMHAAYLRWEMPIVVTSQDEVSLPPDLRGETVYFCELGKKERQEILSTYATSELPSDVDDLTKPFHSAYELSIAAMCLGELLSNPSRTGLFEAYLRRRCNDMVDPILAKRLLSEIAGAMNTDLRSSLPIDQLWRIGEAVLDDQKAPLTTLQSVISCGLVNVRQGQCTFRHELLQRYFEAVALVRECTDLTTLVKTLRRPMHQDLIEFVLGMQSQESAIRACLIAAASSASRLCAACLQGRFGEIARSVVIKDANDMLKHANADISKFVVDVSTNQPHESYVAIEITGGREWSAYERALMSGVADSLQDGLFFDEVVNLIGETENWSVLELEKTIGIDVVKKRSFRSNLFWQMFVMGTASQSLPAATFIRSIDGLFVAGVQRAVLERITQRFAHVEEISIAQVYFLLSFVRGNALPDCCDVARLINHCWNSGIQHLRLKILDCVLYWRDGNMRDATTPAITETLSNLRTADPIIRTQWFETMMAYELVEPPVNSEQLQQDIADILSRPDDPEAQESAYLVISNIFESMFDDVFYKAIENLSLIDHTKLFTMAALAVPSYSMSGDFILSRLLEVDDSSTLPAFRRFVQELDGEAFCPQDSDACFVLGHIGCAKYVDVPGQLTDLSNDDRRAWQCYGEIIFWLSKSNLSDDQIVARCGPFWQNLQSSLAFEAIDPLRRLAHTMRNGPERTSENIVQRLFSIFQNEIRQVLEFGMKHRNNLSAIDKRFKPDVSIREQTTFMIHTLGQIGNSDSINVLLPFIENNYHGQDAVEAIRRLRSGRSTPRITVLHRVP